MAERLQGTTEQLSNRRLMYETFVTAMRRTSDGHSDAHNVIGETDATGRFVVNDYLFYELKTAEQRTSASQNPILRATILDARRPLISVNTDRDAAGRERSYLMAYPEDLHEDGMISRAVRKLLPANWPPNEPFVYQTVRTYGEGGSCAYSGPFAVEEPFLEPDLAAIYDTLITDPFLRSRQ